MDAEALKPAIESLGGDFELVRELGRGATAVVYLLRDQGLGRDVALKVIRGGIGTDEEALARLQREAHLVAQLQHPNIVKLYGTHRLSDGSFALLMEHVPGRNLKEILVKEGALPATRVMGILEDVASALAYAHRRRIVHRDVKPENIYIDEEVGAARLADFGVARPWDQDSRLTIPGASLGTPAYMSPEQIDGKEVDGRSDVYSLGLVGYEMLLGYHPWEGENVFSTIFKQKNETLSMELPGLETFPALSEILEKALQKDPQARWESADTLLKELEAVAQSGGRGGEERHAPETFAAERPAGGGHTRPEDRKDVPWEAIDWVDLEGGGSHTADWPPLQEASGGAPPSGLETILGDDPEFSAPTLVVRKKRSRPVLWSFLIVILAGGSYGGYRWLFTPVEGPGLEPPFPTVALPDDAGPGGSPSSGGASAADASLFALSGANAQGPAGSSAPLATRVATADGTPLEGILVRFQVVEGEGTLEPEEIRSGESGVAETTLTLPTRAGEVVVRATLPGSSEAAALFRIAVQPGPPNEGTTIAGNGQTAPPGEVLPELIGVRVFDEFQNVVPNTPVSFRIQRGGGRAQPSETFTDDEGRAFTRWTLGGGSGPQTLAAVISGAEDAPLIFEAMAEAPTIPEPEPEAPAQPPPPLPARVVPRPFAIGGSHVCGLVGGTVHCRGGTDRGQGAGGSTEGIRALAAGVSHTCGLQEGGAAWCWGANESGQLGDGSTEDKRSAVPVDTGTSFSLLAAGLSHTCGLDGRGAASCWGRNLSGQLGNGSRADRNRPTPVSGGLSFQTIIAGWNHTCGITSGDRAYCWGLNEDGQIGDGTRVDRLAPVRVSGAFRTLAAGARHTCGISGNAVLCWGDNSSGQLGDGGDASSQSTPVPVVGLPAPPSTLAAGAVHTCALLTDESTYCWGQNLHGQLGNGTTESSPSPVAVAGSLRFVNIHAGGGVTCGFLGDGSQYCWGMNQGGQLGDGTRTNRSSPVQVGGNRP
ncbi:MAG: RCC1 domain-containing protein [Longimicrobiales bacterium]